MAPGRGQPQRSLCLVQRPVRRLEPQASIACLRTEALGEIEPDAIECSLQLRREIVILAPDGVMERASPFDDDNDLFQELLSECGGHALPRRSLRATEGP